MNALDDARILAKLDPHGMLKQTASFPAQLARAARVADGFAPFAAEARAIWSRRGELPREVLVCGMGGSAIGGDFAGAWAEAHGVRVSVHRGYELPSWVGPQHLLVFSSYSGNTEETLSAFDAPEGRASARLCISTGGRLAELAKRDGVPLIELPAGLMPRAALGHSLVAQLVLLHHSGLVSANPVDEILATSRFLDAVSSSLHESVPESDNPAKQLARLWHGILPLFCSGTGIMQPVARRWMGQLNENAKAQAHTSVFPEMNHNEIMAWTALPKLRRHVRLFFLRDRDDAEPVKRRMQVTSEILRPRVAGTEWLDTHGDSTLDRMLGTSFLGDYASCYLAFLNEVDPTPVQEIDLLKQRLAASV